MPGVSNDNTSVNDVAVDNDVTSKVNRRPDNRTGFYCGVVEGFYGRPWTTEQRKDLFTKMQTWGMNSYLYAPKDDCKHRAYWREPYTVEEADHLQSLITLATECNIDFCYAISPGLDIVYSSSKEVSTLKRKLDQVAQLGCKAFALLFDDIEPEMCKQDKEVFQSFAQAQVSVTNEIFEYLGHPKFLFCPTQYCTTRAVPTVRNSEYLQTIGTKLAPEIQIMWTGDKVISKTISRASLEDINEVLKRPCIIWDNEHANDYDQKRVYLGPYSGRSPDIIQKLGGVMLNPNCEYGANFVAIHTLAQWSRCTVDGTMNSPNDSISADIKLEIQSGDDGVTSDDLIPTSLPSHVYHPKHALMKALNDWIAEFKRQKTVWGPMSKPQVGLAQPTLIPNINTSLTTNTMVSVGAPLAQMSVTGSINGPVSSIGSSVVAAVPGATSSLSSTSSSFSSTSAITGSHESIAQVGMVPLTASTAAAAAVEAATAGAAVAAAASSGSHSSPQTPQNSEQPLMGMPVGTTLSLPMMNSLVSTNKVVVDQIEPSSSNCDTTMSPAAAAATVLGSGGGPVAAAAAAASVLSTDPMTMSAAMAHAANVVSSNVGVGVNPIEMVPQGLQAHGTTNPVGVPAGLQRVIPVMSNSCLEPMDCLPLATCHGSEDDKLEDSDADLTKNSDINMESCTNPPTPVEGENGTLHKAESTTMLCDPSEPDRMRPPTSSPTNPHGFSNMVCDDHQMSHCDEDDKREQALNIRSSVDEILTVKDLVVLIQLFYLPNEHGQVGVELLNDFHWLKRHATAMLLPGSVGAGSKEDRSEWERRAFRFQSKVAEIQRIFIKLCNCDNRELVYDLYTYLWDMCCVIQTLEGFVQWVSKGIVSPKCQNYVMGQQTWFSGVREAFLSGDHEPWVFRGGLVSDLIRLLPLDSGSDLYIYKHPDVPASLLYLIRPYQPKDEAAIYRLVATAYEEEIDAPMGLCPSDRVLIGDHALGAFLNISPEFCFVCENSSDGTIVAYVVAASDAKAFSTRYHMEWLPEMRNKYPRKVVDATVNEDVMLTPIEELAQSFHTDKNLMKLPPCVYNTSSQSSSSSVNSSSDGGELPCGIAKMRLSSTVVGDFSIAKRLTMLLFACLRASGTMRLFVEAARFDVKTRDFYATLGFMPQGTPSPLVPGPVATTPGSGEGEESEIIYMVRNF